MKFNRIKGFTLIELMITVAIIGILSAIAYPSYQNYILKSWRGKSEACLLELAQSMERRYSVSSPMSFAGGVPSLSCIDDDQMGDRYTFELSVITASTYTLTATPKGPQSSDSCGTLSIDHTGVKSSASASAASSCW